MQSAVTLTESLNAEQFPLLLQHWTKEGDNSRAAKRLDRILAVFKEYESGPIPNAEFNLVKDDVNRLLDYGYFGVMANVSPESMGEIRKNWATYGGIDDYNTSTPAHVAGKLKKAEAAAKKADDPIYKEFYGNVIPKMKEFLPLTAALESLKSRAVKRQPKEKDTPASLKAKYVAPMASKEAGKMVVDALTALSDKLKPVYADALFEDLQSRAKEFASKTAQGQYDSAQHFSDLLTMHSAWERTPEFVTVKDQYSRSGERKKEWWQHKLSDKADETFRKVADQAAQDMQDQFVVKNAKKLDSIVDRKSHKSKLQEAPKPVGSLDISARGTIAGDLMFKFDDGSSFRVRNKVVWKSRYGAGKYTHFVQFPTTFHDVILPDKSAMGTPSEQRMNEVFATA